LFIVANRAQGLTEIPSCIDSSALRHLQLPFDQWNISPETLLSGSVHRKAKLLVDIDAQGVMSVGLCAHLSPRIKDFK